MAIYSEEGTMKKPKKKQRGESAAPEHERAVESYGPDGKSSLRSVHANSIGSWLANMPAMLHWFFLFLVTPTLIFLAVCTPPFQSPDEPPILSALIRSAAADCMAVAAGTSIGESTKPSPLFHNFHSTQRPHNRSGYSRGRQRAMDRADCLQRLFQYRPVSALRLHSPGTGNTLGR